MNGKGQQTQAEPGEFHAVLRPHRSLGPRGFLILMLALGAVSFVTGVVFVVAGAWPVLGFFGLDVALVYLAFKLNYRSGRLYETVDLTPAQLTVTRVHPSGRREQFQCNPYWARVRLAQWPDGRTAAQHRRAGPRARIRPLPHRRRTARSRLGVLREALLAARGGVRI